MTYPVYTCTLQVRTMVYKAPIPQTLRPHSIESPKPPPTPLSFQVINTCGIKIKLIIVWNISNLLINGEGSKRICFLFLFLAPSTKSSSEIAFPIPVPPPTNIKYVVFYAKLSCTALNSVFCTVNRDWNYFHLLLFYF